MLYLQLFLCFMKVGLLGFGGGMAIISLIQNEVLRQGWMTQTEFVDVVAISQMTPGPIGMNCATYVGYTMGGVWGSLVASVAIVLPSLVIMLTICAIYDRIRQKWQQNRAFQVTMRIIRMLVVVLIAHAAYTMITPATFVDYRSWVIFFGVLFLMLLPLWKTNKIVGWVSHPIVLIILSGWLGYILYS